MPRSHKASKGKKLAKGKTPAAAVAAGAARAVKKAHKPSKVASRHPLKKSELRTLFKLTLGGDHMLSTNVYSEIRGYMTNYLTSFIRGATAVAHTRSGAKTITSADVMQLARDVSISKNSIFTTSAIKRLVKSVNSQVRVSEEGWETIRLVLTGVLVSMFKMCHLFMTDRPQPAKKLSTRTWFRAVKAQTMGVTLVQHVDAKGGSHKLGTHTAGRTPLGHAVDGSEKVKASHKEQARRVKRASQKKTFTDEYEVSSKKKEASRKPMSADAKSALVKRLAAGRKKRRLSSGVATKPADLKKKKKVASKTVAKVRDIAAEAEAIW
jgi:histone H3/H4